MSWCLIPPTFSHSKEHGIFRAEKNYADLVSAALPVLAPSGILFVSTNAAQWSPEKFLADVEMAIIRPGEKSCSFITFPSPQIFR